jgi:hypothetical protein
MKKETAQIADHLIRSMSRTAKAAHERGTHVHRLQTVARVS